MTAEEKTQRQPRRRHVWPWVLLAALGAAGLAGLSLGVDALRGKVLGIMAGTTVDPRGALGVSSHSMSTEPQIFEIKAWDGPSYDNRDENGLLPAIRLAIPKADVRKIRYSEKQGWFSTPDVSSIELSLSSQNFEPYRLEQARVHREVLDQLGIKLIRHSERYPDAIIKLDENVLWFPSDDAEARYEAEMLRRGFTEIIASIAGAVELTEKRRTRAVIESISFCRTLRPIRSIGGLCGQPRPLSQFGTLRPFA